MPGNRKRPVSHHRRADRCGQRALLQSLSNQARARGAADQSRSQRTEETEQVKETRPVIKKAARAGFLALIGSLAVWGLAAPAFAEQVAREQDIVSLRLGQRILVDDGSCPAGQIKEVSGAQMTADGIVRTRKCIPRLGTKKK